MSAALALATSAPLDSSRASASVRRAITDELLGKVLRPPRWLRRRSSYRRCGTLVLFAAIAYTVTTGIGVWGNNIPVAWAFGITNFVWWIGIGHAGTFISAILLLLEQKWRTSINRFAEAMTLFAVVQAGMFPLLHLGRAVVRLLARSRTRARWGCGRSSAARCPGTSSAVTHVPHSCRCCSGTSAWSPTSRRCATARPSAGGGASTACSRSAGTAQPSNWRH